MIVKSDCNTKHQQQYNRSGKANQNSNSQDRFCFHSFGMNKLDVNLRPTIASHSHSMITVAIKIISNLTPTHAVFTFCYVLFVYFYLTLNSFLFSYAFYHLLPSPLPRIQHSQEKNYTRKKKNMIKSTHLSFAVCAIVIIKYVPCKIVSIDSPIQQFTV